MAYQQNKKIECETHGTAFMTFICEHLALDPRQIWYSHAPAKDNQWPDSWCSICHQAYMSEGQWNDKNEEELKIRLFCHRCYESHRAQGKFVEIPEEEVSD